MPIPRIWSPVTIAASTYRIVITADLTGGASQTYTSADLSATTHVTAESLLSAVQTALLAATGSTAGTWSSNGGNATTITLSADGYVSINLTGLEAGNPTIKWNNSSDAKAMALSALLGFSATAGAAADTGYARSGSTATATASLQIPSYWSPGVPPESDDEQDYEAVVAVAQTAGGQGKVTRFGDPIEGRRLRFSFVTPERTWERDATSTHLNKAFETLWSSTSVGKFRYSPDRSSPATGAQDYYLLSETLQEFNPTRLSPAVELYSFDVSMGLYVA
jgi:hypothetical protein